MNKQTAIAWPKDRELSKGDWTPPAGTRFVSSDDHLMEVPHLWEDRLKGADKDRAPKFWQDERGIFHMEVEGVSYNTPGFDLEFPEGRPGFWDTQSRLEDMDAEGIDASITFHSRAASLIRMQDKDLWFKCMDVFNEWLSEWRMAAPDRLFPVAYLPTFFKPEMTRDYLQKVKELGFKAIEIPSSPRGVRYNGKEMLPMWEAIAESGLPLSIHIGVNLEFSGSGALGANLNRNLQPFNALFGQLVFSGLFDRFPDLRIVFTEGGAAWVAPTISGADKIYRDYATAIRPKIEHAPSYYWHKNCWTTFMDDPVALDLVDWIGEDKMMWSIDYPHPEGVFGESMSIAKKIYDRLGEKRFKKIVGGNAAALWGI
jgi:predicted TIM-barrel fold metal-dependent hydrolase